MPNVDLSIVVLSYNTEKLTKKCIDTVLTSLDKDQSFTSEVIVLDNASTDDSVKMLKTLKDKRLRQIYSKDNYGYSKGNNIAVNKANSKYILLLNSDIEVIDNAIPKLYHWFTSSRFSFGGGKLLNTDKTVQKSVGRFYTLLVSSVALFLKGDSWGFSRYSPSKIEQVDWLSGACIITKKTTYETMNGFNEDIFMYWDEVDLLYRAKEKGYTTGFFPEAVFIHHEGKSSSSRSTPILRVFEGYKYFYSVHYSDLHLKILQYMLKLKAIIAIVIGKVTNNRYLVDTYKKAYEII